MLTSYNNRLASHERIPFIAASACTVRRVIYYVAYGVETARTRTRIHAAFVDACFDVRAIGINCAFWATIWWISVVVLKTLAHSNAVLVVAVGILTTWRGQARGRDKRITFNG